MSRVYRRFEYETLHLWDSRCPGPPPGAPGTGRYWVYVFGRWRELRPLVSWVIRGYQRSMHAIASAYTRWRRLPTYVPGYWGKYRRTTRGWLWRQAVVQVEDGTFDVAAYLASTAWDTERAELVAAGVCSVDITVTICDGPYARVTRKVIRLDGNNT